MVKNAIQWAISKGKTRKNEIHGQDEYKIPTKSSFQHADVERSTQKIEGTLQLENGAAAFSTAPPAGEQLGTPNCILWGLGVWGQ